MIFYHFPASCYVSIYLQELSDEKLPRSFLMFPETRLHVLLFHDCLRWKDGDAASVAEYPGRILPSNFGYRSGAYARPYRSPGLEKRLPA